MAPCGFALAGRRSLEVAGYLMPKITGEPLHSYGEPRWRREHPIDGADLVAALLALHDALDRLHRAGVVIGDCNDLNVLVDGRRVHLIDVDSYQFGGYACPMWSERFVDPRLCDQTLAPVRPHDAASDWFAFAVMAACAAGPQLFVPTDDGVARIEIVQGAIAQTRTFAETATLVTAGDRLALHPTGLDAIRPRDAIRMHLT